MTKMQLHYYDQSHKFYLYSEEIEDILEEDARQGLGIPAFSTILLPPLEQCKDNEIPAFENNNWRIVKNVFWRPKIEEINYDAGRSITTFEFTELNPHDFMGFPSMPQLCNTFLVSMRICQSISIINNKFSQCLEIHKAILQDQVVGATYSLQGNSKNFILSPIYEFKTEMELIVYLMRRILDSLVQLIDLMVHFSDFEKTKKLTHESIGSVLSPKVKKTLVKQIILGDENYEKDTTGFLGILNDLFNGFKHSLMHDEVFGQVGVDFPTFTGILVKHADHERTIQYHNHNAYHLMMGFQDCVTRILRNKEIYRTSCKE
ncbi:MAG: hypothetical protein AAGG51_19535 [Cyanobacteria bacterium P01_G01_bin.54]